MTDKPAARASQETPRLKANARPWIIVGFLLIFAIFGLIGAWASTAPIASAVIAQGNVTVDGKRKVIQHLEGGIVDSIEVEDGDVVRAGDILVRLDPTQAKSKLAVIRSALNKDLAAEARLIAERDDLDKIHFPDELLSQEQDPDVRRLMKSQKHLFSVRGETLSGEVELLGQRIAQLQQQIVGLEFQLESNTEQARLIKDELQGLESLLEKGQTTRPRVLKLRRRMAALKGEKGELTAQVARLKERISETKLQIIQNQREFRKSVSEELNKTQSRLQDLRERAIAARDVLARVDIRAPIGGVIVNTEFHTTGAVIKPGQRILEIVPGEKNLIVDTAVEPKDIDNVVIGQSAKIRITAFKQRTAPLLNGTVSYVSADSLENEKTGETYFTAYIEIADGEMKKLDDMALKPGMQAEAMIKTGARTAIQYLVQPIADSMNRSFREE